MHIIRLLPVKIMFHRLVQHGEIPQGHPEWVNLFRYLPHPLHDLRIAGQSVDKLRIESVDEALNHGTETRLRRRPPDDVALTPCDERLKINTLKLAAVINYEAFRETTVAADTFTNYSKTGDM